MTSSRAANVSFRYYIRVELTFNSHVDVVVGGGSAGCALAARLAEGDSSATVCLIEAGPDHKDMSIVNVPGLNLATWEGKIDWRQAAS